MENISAKVALKQLIGTKGINILSNGKQCMSVLMDMAPKDKDGLENIKVAFEKNLQLLLVDANSKSMAEKQNSIDTMYKRLIGRLNEQTARDICDIFIYALGWNVSVKTTSPIAPVQQNPPTYTQLKQTQYQYPPQPPRKTTKTMGFPKVAILSVCALVVIIGSVVLLSGRNNKSSIDEPTSLKDAINSDEEYDQILTDNNSSESDLEDSSESELEESTIEVTEPVPTILSIDSIPESTTSVDKIDIQQMSDKITSEKEKKTYEFTSAEAGRYRFELSDVPNNIYFRMYLYNADMEQLVYDYNKTNGRGITCDLDANALYHFVLEQQDNTGSYTLNIGSQKRTEDISAYNKVSDSIQFTDQRNIYSFTSTEAGRYRFELSDVPNDIYFRMYLYNSDMEQLVYDYNKTNGRGITCDLDANSQYYFVIEQQDNIGSYVLNIGRQKECHEISGYEKLSDSTQFTDQRNIYSFSPTESGNYSFIFSNVSNNIYYRMYLYNADMEQLVYDYNKTNDRGISQELKADEKYYIVIEQQDGVGKYTMNYGIYKEE